MKEKDSEREREGERGRDRERQGETRRDRERGRERGRERERIETKRFFGCKKISRFQDFFFKSIFDFLI